MKISMTVNRWPYSQECMGCVFACFLIEDDKYGSSAYACAKNIDLEGQDELDCPHKRDDNSYYNDSTTDKEN